MFCLSVGKDTHLSYVILHVYHNLLSLNMGKSRITDEKLALEREKKNTLEKEKSELQPVAAKKVMLNTYSLSELHDLSP